MTIVSPSPAEGQEVTHRRHRLFSIIWFWLTLHSPLHSRITPWRVLLLYYAVILRLREISPVLLIVLIRAGLKGRAQPRSQNSCKGHRVREHIVDHVSLQNIVDLSVGRYNGHCSHGESIMHISEFICTYIFTAKVRRRGTEFYHRD